MKIIKEISKEKKIASDSSDLIITDNKTNLLSNTKTIHHSKGQAILLSHAIIVSFGIFMVFIVVTSFATLREDFQNFVATNEIDKLCLTIKDAAEKVYYTGDYTSPVGSLSTISLNLPDRIADIPYKATFQGNSTITVETKMPKITTSCKVGINVSYSGSTSGGITQVSFNNSATRKIEMKNV